jgi:hypothetical protein
MTLLIASIRPADVLLTADGRCQKSAAGKVTAVEDDYQKLHPLADHPLAVAHHGENWIGGGPVKAFIGRFYRGLNAGNFTVLEIADQLREYAHGPVRARLKEVGKGFASGFWVVGFAYPFAAPVGVELFWKWHGDHLSYEERVWRPVTIVTGGSGQFQIPRTNVNEVDGTSADRVRAYHKSLMDAAIAADVKDNPVGGHVHELRLTREGCEWTLPPPGG